MQPKSVRFFFFIACFFLFGNSSLYAAKIRIDFFGEPGCAECDYVKKRIIPKLSQQFDNTLDFFYYDLNETHNYVKLVELEDRLGQQANAAVYLCIGNRTLLAGVTQIENLAATEIQAAIESQLSTSEHPLQEETSAPIDAIAKRYNDFTLGAVIIAGLADGINICAITTLVFFISLLAQSGATSRIRWILGLAFAGASYVTYFLIGLGLLKTLHAIKGFTSVRFIIELITIITLLLLAMLSFRDAVRYARSKKAGDVALQLPAGIKRRIHAIMRRSMGVANVFWAGLVAGTLVTILEGVCSGQTYAPTLVLMGFKGKYGAWGLLALYNALFVMPLLVVLTLVSLGLKIEQLTSWTRRHVVPSKILLGSVFLMLAILLMFLRRIV